MPEADMSLPSGELEVAVSTTVSRGLKAIDVVQQVLCSGSRCRLILQTLGSTEMGEIVDRMPRESVDGNFRLVVLEGKGLSRSRNAAIETSTAAWLLFADDDIRYLPGALGLVANALSDLGDVDVATFQMVFPDGSPARPYPQRAIRHSWRTVLRVSSVTIAVRPGRVREAGLMFDPRLGLGAQVPTGEENEWLLRCLRAGLNVRHLPIDIVQHDHQTSSSEYDRFAAINKGRMLSIMFGVWAVPLSVAFALRHHRRFREGGVMKFLGLILTGAMESRRRK
jgi:glycosyltransferase involved in cell wall biosynthesis